MSEVQSFAFDFQRVRDFFDRWNVDWKVTGDFGVDDKFQLVFSTYAPNNETECIGSDGRLTDDVTIPSSAYIKDCTFRWENEEIILDEDVIFNLGDVSVPCKAMFLRCKSNGIVLGYSIHMTSLKMTNQLKFSEDTVFWSIRDGE